jgi:hypothetical protein
MDKSKLIYDFKWPIYYIIANIEIGGIANSVPALSLKAQFRPWTTKTIVLVLKLSHLAQFRPWTTKTVVLVLKLLHLTQIRPWLIDKYPFYPSTPTCCSLLAAGEPSAHHCRCHLREGRPLQSGGLLPAKSTMSAPHPASVSADLRRDRGRGRPWMGRGRA